MAKIDNPIVVVGQQATLITKNITANGDYSASSDGADGYSSVHVEVPVGETVYLSEYNAMPYAEKMTIPAGTYLEIPPKLLSYRNCSYLREFSCLRTDITSAPTYSLDGDFALRKVYLPYITNIGRCCPSMQNPSEPATAEFGSIGHPVTDVHREAFGWGSGGRNWTVTFYVNATTLADIPTGVTQDSPWGAPYLTIVYKNSTTGEVIES